MTQTPTDALRLVPIEPTAAMMDAAFDAFEINHPMQYRTGTEARKAIWSAMLSAAPASPLPGGGWQDISTAPKDGTRFFIFGYWRPSWKSAEPEFSVVSRRDDSTYFAEINGEATHWMPLPAAPTGDARNGKGEG